MSARPVSAPLLDRLIDDGLLVDRPHLADLVARLGAVDIVAGLEVLLMWEASR